MNINNINQFSVFITRHNTSVKIGALGGRKILVSDSKGKQHELSLNSIVKLLERAVNGSKDKDLQFLNEKKSLTLKNAITFINKLDIVATNQLKNSSMIQRLLTFIRQVFGNLFFDRKAKLISLGNHLRQTHRETKESKPAEEKFNHISKLDPEQLSNVFTFFKPADLVFASRVNKSFRALANQELFKKAYVHRHLAFGSSRLNQYFGSDAIKFNENEISSLPNDIVSLLTSDFRVEQKIKASDFFFIPLKVKAEAYMLVRVPAEIHGKPTTIEGIVELANKSFKQSEAVFRQVKGAELDKSSVEKSIWILTRLDWSNPSDDQIRFIVGETKQAYDRPTALEEIFIYTVCVALHRESKLKFLPRNVTMKCKDLFVHISSAGGIEIKKTEDEHSDTIAAGSRLVRRYS